MITEVISLYHVSSRSDKHHRFKSWEHCYRFFLNNYHNLKDEDILDQGCLHLAFFLASWGMLRGSSFLFQKDYKVHQYFIKEVMMKPAWKKYYEQNQHFLMDHRYVEGMDKLITETKRIYPAHVQKIGEEFPIHVTDTCASKILLGVFGNTPAYDRYFTDGLRQFALRTQFDEKSLKQLVDFYHQNEFEFVSCLKMFRHDGAMYTPMKLIDQKANRKPLYLYMG